jgi:signal transduction histidine kinase/CheY-like chemotaxis protein
LRDVLYRPAKAELSLGLLPDDFRELGQGLKYLAECIAETRELANALSKGNLDSKLPSPNNEMASPLKALYASLKHLAWQTQQVARGDYKQRVDFMGDFANAFNSMIEQLDCQRADLIEAKVVAEAASESKSAFLAAVSHEIRTPLNAVLGLSLVELEGDLPPATRCNMEKIYSSGTSLLGLINDILDISKIEAGEFEIISSDYDFASLVSEVAELNVVRIADKKISFELAIDETVPARLCGDELRVKQVLNNLLSNAFKYTEEGKITFRIGWRRQGGDALVEFAVSDTGMGIKKEDMHKLFKEYVRLNSRPNRNVEGTGLGLSITKRLVGMMGGTIAVDSEYGVGSSFSVEMPQKMAGDAPIGAQTADRLRGLCFAENRLARRGKLERSHMPYGRVLVVDDVATNLDVARGLMAPYGLLVDCVSSGQEAIDKIRSCGGPGNGRYDVVFMDHMMPDMDGVEAARIIRGEMGTDYARTVPIVALTANALSGSEEKFLNAGFDGFLPKPIDVARLDAELNKWVRDRHGHEAQAEAEKGRGANPEADSADGSLEISPELRGMDADGLDIAEGIRRYGGEAAYLQVLRSYAAHTPGLVESLNGFLEERLFDYAIAVHGLKGASYGICAPSVGKLAEVLEFAAKSGDYETVRANHETLVGMANALVCGLNDTLKAASRAGRSDAARECRHAPDAALLRNIMEAAARYSASEMEEALAELERYEYDADGDLVAWLRESLENIEYDAIAARLEEALRPA